MRARGVAQRGQPRLPRADAPIMADAEYDRSSASSSSSRPRSRAGHARIADPARRRRAVGDLDEVRTAADAVAVGNAFSEDELRAFDARVRRGLGLPAAPEPRPSCATSPSSRSTAWPSRSATSAAGSSRARRAATARPARTSRPICAPSRPIPQRLPEPVDARGAGRGVHAQGRVRAHQRRARGGRAAAVRQPAQQRRGLAAPDRPRR